MPGYQNTPGWVKGNPLNNDSYVAKAKEAFPEHADEIQHLYDSWLSSGEPFNVAQIKIKFGSLSFSAHYIKEDQ